MGLAGDCLEEGRATRSRRSQHNQHLASLDETVTVAQNVDLASLVSLELFEQGRTLEPDVSNTLLVIRVGTETMDVETAEGDAGCAWGSSVLVAELQVHHGFCPGAGIEAVAVGVQWGVWLCGKGILVVGRGIALVSQASGKTLDLVFSTGRLLVVDLGLCGFVRGMLGVCVVAPWRRVVCGDCGGV
jgi:hypothetical protein